MTDILTATAEHYTKIFSLTDEEDYHTYKPLISSEAFGETEGFIRNKRILELGSGGIGHAIAGFLSHGAKSITGIDISGDNIANLKKRFRGNRRVQLYRGDIGNLPDNLGMFNIIYSDGVIHHTSDPGKVLRAAYRHLLPGGMLIVTFYGKNGSVTRFLHLLRAIRPVIPKKIFYKAVSPWPHLGFLLGDYIFAPVLRTYSGSDAISLVQNAGFRKVERIPNRVVITGWTRYLRPSQLNYKSSISRILHGNGWITLKARKEK